MVDLTRRALFGAIGLGIVGTVVSWPRLTGSDIPGRGTDTLTVALFGTAVSARHGVGPHKHGALQPRGTRHVHHHKLPTLVFQRAHIVVAQQVDADFVPVVQLAPQHRAQLRGIGQWTVDMYLLFDLCRPNVLPVGDLGVRKGMQRWFGLRQLPEPERMRKLAAPWQPYCSAAAWYMWRVLQST